MKISACSIVKNEALNIGRSIESYKDAVDEIIIVDTGSNDNTVEICKAHGAKVLHFKWCDDFSAAKNYALEHTKGDWIIFLDADEWFVPKMKRSYLVDALRKVDPRAYGLQTTFCDIDLNTKKVSFRGVTTRIFRGSPKIKYNGSIHEKLLNNGNMLTLQKITEIEIFHSGYMDVLMKSKAKRNIDILYKIYNKGEADTDLYFYLCRENYELRNVDEVVKFFDLFMKQKGIDEIIKGKDALVSIYEVMYKTMVTNPDRFTQLEIDNLLEKAYQKHPTLPLHSYLIGTEKLKAGEYSESYEWISCAIALNKEYSGTYINKFVGCLADSYYKLGCIRKKQDRQEDALTHYMEAANIASSIELPFLLSKMIAIIGEQPEEEIILFFNSILDMNKKENVECMLSALKRTRLHKAFIYYAVKYNQDFDGQNETTYIAMMLSGHGDVAIETAVEASRNYNQRTVLELQADKYNIVGVEEDNLREDYDISHHDSYDTVDNEVEIHGANSENEAMTIYESWHLDYAVIGILYSKSWELYHKYKQYFSKDQNEIIEAYLGDKKITKITEKLKETFEKLYTKMFFIFEEEELNVFRKMIES